MSATTTLTPRALANGETYLPRLGYGTLGNALAYLATLPQVEDSTTGVLLPAVRISPADTPLGEGWILDTLRWARVPEDRASSILVDADGTTWAVLTQGSETYIPWVKHRDVRGVHGMLRAEYDREARRWEALRLRAWLIADQAIGAQHRKHSKRYDRRPRPSFLSAQVLELLDHLEPRADLAHFIGGRGAWARVFYFSLFVRDDAGTMQPVLCTRSLPRIPPGAFSSLQTAQRIAWQFATQGGMVTQPRKSSSSRRATTPDKSPTTCPAQQYPSPKGLTGTILRPDPAMIRDLPRPLIAYDPILKVSPRPRFYHYPAGLGGYVCDDSRYEGAGRITSDRPADLPSWAIS